MKFHFLACFAFVISFATMNLAHAGIHFNCTYQNYGVPFASVSFAIDDQGQYDPTVEVTHHGRVHQESLTAETLGPGEWAHAWISKESTENSIELIVFIEPQKLGQSKMINHHIPIGKEMWGDCEITETSGGAQ